MKDYYDRDYKLIKSRPYLVWGLVMAALSMIMIAVTILTALNNADIILIVTGIVAAIAWAVGAFVCIRVYYKDNRVEIKEKAKEIAETVENAVKK